MRCHAEAFTNGFQLRDEDMRGEGDDAERQHGLKTGPGEIRITGPDFQRLQVFLFLIGFGGIDLTPDIEGVSGKKQDAKPGLIGENDEAERHLDGEDGEEAQLVAAKALGVDGHGMAHLSLQRLAALALVKPEGEADDPVSNGGQHQWATHGRADTDVLLLRRLAEDDRHKGDGAFGQGGAEGGQDGTDGGGAEVHVLAAPFDAVDEEFARQIDGDGRAEKEQEGKEHRVTQGPGKQINQWRTQRLARQKQSQHGQRSRLTKLNFVDHTMERRSNYVDVIPLKSSEAATPQ